MINWLFIFFALVIVDFIWAENVKAVADKKPFTASFWSMAFLVTYGLATIEYVHDPILLIPACLGGFVGTYLSTIRNSAKISPVESLAWNQDVEGSNPSAVTK